MEALATPGIPVGARVQQRRVNVRWEYGMYGRTHVLGTEIRNHQIIYCRTKKKKKKNAMSLIPAPGITGKSTR